MSFSGWLRDRWTQRLLLAFALTVGYTAVTYAEPWMTVNSAYADYLTLHCYINETNDSETLNVDF